MNNLISSISNLLVRPTQDASQPLDSNTPQDQQLTSKPTTTISSDADDTPVFTDDPCNTCSNPCDEGHAAVPSYMKIDYDEPLRGTMKGYGGQILVLAGDGKTWPERIEEAVAAPSADPEDETEGSVVGMVYAAVQELVEEKKMKKRIVITACDRLPEGEHEASELVTTVTQTELLLLPHFWRLQNVSTNSSAQSLKALQQIILNWNAPSKQLTTSKSLAFLPPPPALLDLVPPQWKLTTLPENLHSIILVCTHSKRDKRCGTLGPLLISEFEHHLLSHPSKDGKQVWVAGGSHWGGHKFAGNVIVYSKSIKGGRGIWYGRVKGCHVSHIVEKTVWGGEVFEELFRGWGDGVFATAISESGDGGERAEGCAKVAAKDENKW
ncbi:hypothetical protein HDV05_002954 [Chytridiales sp. JEL 0842]|nr:hypothetical protein HDV05_002954 [Chytridiales sp. JEL 0842]